MATDVCLWCLEMTGIKSRNVVQKSPKSVLSRLDGEKGAHLQGHGGKLGYKLLCWTVPLGGLDRAWLSRGKDRAQCAVLFTARLPKWQLNRERKCWRTDLRQMMKTQGSTMGLRA